MSARGLAITASAALFAISLLLPGFSTEPEQGGTIGWWILLVGWLGLVATGESAANLAWLANAALLLAWRSAATGHRGRAATAALVALALAVLPALTRQVAVDEAGMPRAVIAFGWGYAAWIGAMLAALGAAMVPGKAGGR